MKINSISARRNFFGTACKGGRRVGVPGAEPPDAGEVFKKFVKKSMKNVPFFQKFSRKFINFFKIFRNFGENLNKLENL